MVEEHLAALKQSGQYSQTTIDIAATWLQRFQVHFGDRDLTALKPKDLDQWHKQLAWTPGPSGKLYSENTLNQAVGTIRRFYRGLLAAGLLSRDPTSELVTPHVKAVRLQRAYTAAEKRALLSSPDLESPTGIRDRAVLGVLLETGISRPACSRLELKDIQFDTSALLSRGRKQEIHCLGAGLLEDLERYLRESRRLLIRVDNEPAKQNEAFFLTINGDRLSANCIAQLQRHHRKRADL